MTPLEKLRDALTGCKVDYYEASWHSTYRRVAYLTEMPTTYIKVGDIQFYFDKNGRCLACGNEINSYRRYMEK